MATSLTAKQRLRLIKQLNALPQAQFNEIVFALEPPPGVISSGSGAQGDRAKELLDWSEGPTDPSIAAVLDLLSDYLSLEDLGIAPTPAETPPAAQSKSPQAAATESASAAPLRLEEPEGLVPVGSPFYIERPPVETDCYETIERPGSLIRIKAPRQMGKTSLMMRILAHGKTLGYQTVRLSFQTAEADTLKDLDSFLQWFCSSVTEELELEDKLADYWKGSRGIVRRCQRYFEKYLLAEINGPLILGLDEVDQVFEHADIATDFFGMLRVWHGREI
jgi:hypothetical protein